MIFGLRHPPLAAPAYTRSVREMTGRANARTHYGGVNGGACPMLNFPVSSICGRPSLVHLSVHLSWNLESTFLT